MVRCIFLDQSLGIPQNCPTNRVYLRHSQLKSTAIQRSRLGTHAWTWHDLVIQQ